MQTYKVTINDAGTIHWFDQEDKLHREDGPAIEYADGDKFGFGMDNIIEKMVQLLNMLMVPKFGMFITSVIEKMVQLWE
jgi:hypothetical protein